MPYDKGVNLSEYSGAYRVSAAVGTLLRAGLDGSNARTYFITVEVKAQTLGSSYIRALTRDALQSCGIDEYCLYTEPKTSSAITYFGSSAVLSADDRENIRMAFAKAFKVNPSKVNDCLLGLGQVEDNFRDVSDVSPVYTSYGLLTATKGFVHSRDNGGDLIKAIENGYRTFLNFKKKAAAKKEKQLVSQPVPPVPEKPDEPVTPVERPTVTADEKAIRREKLIDDIVKRVVDITGKDSEPASSHVETVTIAESSDDIIASLIAAHEQLLASHNQLLAVLKASRSAA